VFARAVKLWRDGCPYQAYAELEGAGMADEWLPFQRVATRWSRRRFLALIQGASGAQ
jgi:hypothetical protein